jgi:hypothetical protein
MPWTPQKASETVGRLAGEREQLIGLVAACQQSLTELLAWLRAAKAPGREPDAPAQSDLLASDGGHAECLVAATIGRLEEVFPRPAAPSARPEDVEAVRTATEELAARVAAIDRGIEERMIRTADLAARGAEVAIQDRMRAVRAEVAALQAAADGLRTDVVRLDAGLEARIAARVDAARRAGDVELARLRARVEALATRMADPWTALGGLLASSVGAVTAGVGWVLGRLVR